MFDSLDEQISRNEDRVAGGHNARLMKYAIYAVVGFGVIAAVFLGMHYLG